MAFDPRCAPPLVLIVLRSARACLQVRGMAAFASWTKTLDAPNEPLKDGSGTSAWTWEVPFGSAAVLLLLKLSAAGTAATAQFSPSAGVDVAADVALADMAQSGAILARTITLAPSEPNGPREWSGTVCIILKGSKVAGPREHHELRVVEADPPVRAPVPPLCAQLCIFCIRQFVCLLVLLASR